MGRTRRYGGRGDDPGQLQLEWGTIAGRGSVATTSPLPASRPVVNDSAAPDAAPPLVQRLPWDFQSTFPQPTPEAMDAGVISDEDATPENVRAIHEEHARELLVVLSDLDTVLDARRMGVDPRNNKKPMLQSAKERLQKFFETEPDRLQRWWQNQMDVYESAFGTEAAAAFGKAIRAWHAGIEVTAEQPHAVTPTPTVAAEETPTRPRIRKQTQADRHESRRIVARLPVPKPLPSAVAAGRFGQEENGKPVCPGTHEVREITEQHAEKFIGLLDTLACAPATGKDALQSQFSDCIAAYAEDFGQHAADRLEAYARRQAALDPESRRER